MKRSFRNDSLKQKKNKTNKQKHWVTSSKHLRSKVLRNNVMENSKLLLNNVWVHTLPWVNPKEKTEPKKIVIFSVWLRNSPASSIYYSAQQRSRAGNFLEIAILQLLRRSNLAAIYKNATMLIWVLYGRKVYYPFFA